MESEGESGTTNVGWCMQERKTNPQANINSGEKITRKLKPGLKEDQFQRGIRETQEPQAVEKPWQGLLHRPVLEGHVAAQKRRERMVGQQRDGVEPSTLITTTRSGHWGCEGGSFMCRPGIVKKTKNAMGQIQFINYIYPTAGYRTHLTEGIQKESPTRITKENHCYIPCKYF